MLQQRGIAIALGVLGLAISALVFGPSLELTYTGKNDFMNFYSGTHLAFTDRMYDVAANLRVMRDSAGWENSNRLFNRPPFYALLLWPLGRLPFLTAVHLWELLVVATAIAFCLLWPGDRKTAALACCWSLPLFHVFANAQDVAILLLLIALAIRAMRARREREAGLLFALCSIKFHLFVLLPLLILRQRRWRLLSGLAMGGAGLTMLSFIPGGWDWPVKYFNFLRNPIGLPWPTRMPTIDGICANLPHGGGWAIAGTIGVVLLVWHAVGKYDFEYGLAAVLTGGILVAPHAYLSDCALALPAVLITLPRVTLGAQRYFQLFMLSPVCYVWALINPAWMTGVALIAYLTSISLGGDFHRAVARAGAAPEPCLNHWR